MAPQQNCYLDKYFYKHYEHRHVTLPRELSKQVPRIHLMSEEEQRMPGVRQSPGWAHYVTHRPETHILLSGRPLPKEQQKRSLSGDHQLNPCQTSCMCISGSIQ
uniref:Cyclin-dependent kinases regulatory subunit n=1 Tax=Catagonus wagneri TaxID=51154 RepID=A0A8C3WUC6_9CETA